ncbi:type II toxin-antitoxin system RelE family toxin [Helicobacter apodemus]|uniref:Addiction module toxin RelE n=1 Tax=Helicobacter apodemus TaxID=135569 RepID=A0A2U8FFH2_9HELI|nr:hypothetical protein [Helicobacter apodemus]AWI34175.1 hypothetical protein CDV25_04895 [Helicobacter apodemus]
MFKVIYKEEVISDLSILPSDVFLEVMSYFEKYKTNPYLYSKPLYNRGNIKLQGLRKTYVANATYRIVIHIEQEVAKVVSVIAVGKRENKDVYKIANLRNK